jgi:hypothetical protein
MKQRALTTHHHMLVKGEKIKYEIDILQNLRKIFAKTGSARKNSLPDRGDGLSAGFASTALTFLTKEISGRIQESASLTDKYFTFCVSTMRRFGQHARARALIGTNTRSTNSSFASLPLSAVADTAAVAVAATGTPAPRKLTADSELSVESRKTLAMLRQDEGVVTHWHWHAHPTTPIRWHIT